MQIEKRIGREKKRCGYAPFNSAQQAIKLRSLRSLRPSGKLPSATCFIAGPLACSGKEQNDSLFRQIWSRNFIRVATLLTFLETIEYQPIRKFWNIITRAFVWQIEFWLTRLQVSALWKKKNHLIERCGISFVGFSFRTLWKFWEALFRHIGLNYYCSETEN